MSMMRWFLSIVLVVTLLGTLFSAPTPLPKLPKKPINTKVPQLIHKDLIGDDWFMLWGGGEWNFILWVNGGYECINTSGSSRYIGSWMLGAKSEFIVTEAHVSSDGTVGSYNTWWVVWERDKKDLIDKSKLTGEVFYEGGSKGPSYSQSKIKKK